MWDGFCSISSCICGRERIGCRGRAATGGASVRANWPERCTGGRRASEALGHGNRDIFFPLIVQDAAVSGGLESLPRFFGLWLPGALAKPGSWEGTVRYRGRNNFLENR